jgi:hypothetical protein
LPLHAPLHPAKDEFEPAVAVSVTWEPTVNFALHVGGQTIPAGLLVTVPVPVPARLTLSKSVFWTIVLLNTAVTCSLALSVTTQLELPPVHAPVHPAKDEFVPAVAVRVTSVPGSKSALHVEPQLMPAGLLETLPWPVPARVTASTGEALNSALTEVFCVNVTLQTPVPLQAPDHPAKKEFAVGVAVSVIALPLEKLALHVCPQLMPAGLLLIIPWPTPEACTLSW